MYHRGEIYGTGVYDVPPSPSGLVFPSEVRQNYVSSGEEYRPRSQSADTRRTGVVDFPSSSLGSRRHNYTEEHINSYPVSDIVTYGAASAGSPGLDVKRPSPPPRNQSHYVNFPSSFRDQHNQQHQQQHSPVQQHQYHQSLQQQHATSSGSSFNSAHNFTQHLRERSPSSSSALLNLLQRYPSARQSVYNEANRLLKSDGINSPGPDSAAYQHQQQPSQQQSQQQSQQRSSSFAPESSSSSPSGYPSGPGVLSASSSATLPKPSPAASRRTYSLPTTEAWNIPPREQTGGLSSSYHSEYRSSPVGPTFYESPQSISPLSSHAHQQLQQQQQQPQHFQQQAQDFQRPPSESGSFVTHSTNYSNSGLSTSTPSYQNLPPPSVQDSEFNYRSLPQQHKFYTTETNNNHLPPQLRNNPTWQNTGDITQFDSLLNSVLLNEEEDMNRSTNEWRNSFAQMQEKFRNLPAESHESGILHGFASSGAPTLPRRGHIGLLAKSSSHHDVPESSLLAKAVERRASEAPEQRKSGAIDNFWVQTVASRPQSPTIQRISNSLTAAERLQMLQEPTDCPSPVPSNPPNPPVRMMNGGRSSIAARREQYMNEAASSNFVGNSLQQNSSSVSSPNFSDLDNAVRELNSGIRSTGYSQSARRLGGCARFPTDEHAFSPPRQSILNLTAPNNRLLHSPSPTDSVSETSSVYQVPTGLPHPKPKHNIKEQLHQIQQQQQSSNGYYPRSGMLRTSPNFPVPTTGSVASRITEFERRPGTPTLQILNVSTQEKPATSVNSMSPKSSVFRAKPVIHVDLGSHHTRTPHHEGTVFEFQQKSAQSWNETADLNATPVSALSKDFKKLSIESPHGHRSILAETVDETHNGHISKLCLDDSFSGHSDSSNSLDNSKVGRGLNASKSFRLLDDLNADPEKDIYLPQSRKNQQLINYPKFHFPQGKPVSQMENDAALRRVCEVFRTFPNQVCTVEHIDEVCEAAGIPRYWKRPLYNALTKNEERPATQMEFTAFWRAMTSIAHDEAARFVYTLTAGAGSRLSRKHFEPLVLDVIYSHPGLEFYRSSVEFHDKYCDVVISRIFWNVNRPWATYLTVQDIRKSDLLEKIRDLQVEDDINKSFRYFSYEHFYVIYCNFWELDTNHDMLISRNDLERHGKYAVPRDIVDRIFSGAVRPLQKVKESPDYIGISEYTYFLLADEDKTHPMSAEYWFRILDLDGDGIISFYDMEEFHNHIIDALSQEGIETLKFEDVVCHLIDAVNPKNKTAFKLSDLKGNKMAPKFFNSLVNWRKFYHQETNEVSEARVEDESGRELTDWDRYCIEEYEALMESASDGEGVENFEVHLDDDDDAQCAAYNQLL